MINPAMYHDVEQFAEAIRAERLATDQCPNGCMGLLDYDVMGDQKKGNIVVLMSCRCGWAHFCMWDGSGFPEPDKVGQA